MKRRIFLKSLVATIAGVSAVGSLSGCIPHFVRVEQKDFRFYHGDDASNTIFTKSDKPLDEPILVSRGGVIFTTTDFIQTREHWAETEKDIVITDNSNGQKVARLAAGKRYPILGLMRRKGQTYLMLCVSGCGGWNNRDPEMITLLNQDGTFAGEVFRKSHTGGFEASEKGYTIPGPSKVVLKKHSEDNPYPQGKVKEYVYDSLEPNGTPVIKVYVVKPDGTRERVWTTFVSQHVTPMVGSYQKLRLGKLNDDGTAEFILTEKRFGTSF